MVLINRKNVGIGAVVLGTTMALAAVADKMNGFYHPHEQAPVVQEYKQARVTLSSLTEDRDEIEDSISQRFPYRGSDDSPSPDPYYSVKLAIDDVLKDERSKIKSLNEAIIAVQLQMWVLEDNYNVSTWVKYEKDREESSNHFIFGGSLLAVMGALVISCPYRGKLRA